MKHTLTLTTEHLLLLPLGEEHIESLRLLRNRSENRVWFFDGAEITPEQQKAWFASQQATDGDHMFAVFFKDDPTRFLGAVALYHYNKEERSFEIGRLLLDAARLPMRGLGKELVFAACKLGFEELHAGRLYAEVFADNERSLSRFTENGFAVFGEKEIHAKRVLMLEKLSETG